MRRLAALAVLVASLTFAGTTVAGAQHQAAPQRHASKAGFISFIKSQVCSALDVGETAELPFSIGRLLEEGDVEAGTVILFGANKALCGGGHVEKLFSLAHDWLLGAVTHNLKLSKFDFGSFKLKLPNLVRNLRGLPTLKVRNVSVPTATFSRNLVGADSLVPMSVSWLAPFASSVSMKVIPLSSPSPARTYSVQQHGLVGSTQSVGLGLSSGRWQLCIRANEGFGTFQCGYPFWITICSNKADSLNHQLANGSYASVPFYGSQVGVAADSAYGSAQFNVDLVRGTYVNAPFNIFDFGQTARFFAYWAWNLGEASHRLYVYAPIGPYGNPISGHILDVVSISSVVAAYSPCG